MPPDIVPLQFLKVLDRIVKLRVFCTHTPPTAHQVKSREQSGNETCYSAIGIFDMKILNKHLIKGRARLLTPDVEGRAAATAVN